MTEIIYKPEDVGITVINSKGKPTKIRKYHMTDIDIKRAKEKWIKELSITPNREELARKAGKKFFNPYRKGIYYYQIQCMFLLGANEWHSLSTIISKMYSYMSDISLTYKDMNSNAWERFRGKASRNFALKTKSYIGRIQENMTFFQRLNRLHPCGYKLMQVCSAVDIKRITVDNFPDGKYYYRLSTYESMDKALPIRDFSKFDFPRHESKYVNYRFLGKIITRDKTLCKGVEL